MVNLKLLINPVQVYNNAHLTHIFSVWKTLLKLDYWQKHSDLPPARPKHVKLYNAFICMMCVCVSCTKWVPTTLISRNTLVGSQGELEFTADKWAVSVHVEPPRLLL